MPKKTKNPTGEKSTSSLKKQIKRAASQHQLPTNSSNKRTLNKQSTNTDSVGELPVFETPRKNKTDALPSSLGRNSRRSSLASFKRLPDKPQLQVSKFDLLEQADPSLFTKETEFSATSSNDDATYATQRIQSAELKTIPLHSLATTDITGNDSEFILDLRKRKECIQNSQFWTETKEETTDNATKAKQYLYLSDTLQGIREPLNRLVERERESKTKQSDDHHTVKEQARKEFEYLERAKRFSFENDKKKKGRFLNSALYFMRAIDQTHNYHELQTLLDYMLSGKNVHKNELNFLSPNYYFTLQNIRSSTVTSENKASENFASLMGHFLEGFLAENHRKGNIDRSDLEENSRTPFLIFKHALITEVHLIGRQISSISKGKNLKILNDRPTENAPILNGFLEKDSETTGKQKPEYIANISATIDSISFLYDQLFSSKSAELGAISSDLASRHATIDGSKPEIIDDLNPEETSKIEKNVYSEVQVGYFLQAQDTHKKSGSLTATWGTGWGKSHASKELPLFLSTELTRRETEKQTETQQSPAVKSTKKNLTNLSPQPSKNQKTEKIQIARSYIEELRNEYFTYLDHNTHDVRDFVAKLNSDPSDPPILDNRVISVDEFTFMHRLLPTLKQAGWHCSEESDIHTKYRQAKVQYELEQSDANSSNQEELEQKRSKYHYYQAAYQTKARFDLEKAINSQGATAFFYQGSESPDIFQEQYDQLIKEINDQQKSDKSKIIKQSSKALFQGPKGQRLDSPPFLDVFKNTASGQPQREWQNVAYCQNDSFRIMKKDYLLNIAWHTYCLCNVTDEAIDSIERYNLQQQLIPQTLPNAILKRLDTSRNLFHKDFLKAIRTEDKETKQKLIKDACVKMAGHIVECAHNKKKAPGQTQYVLDKSEQELVTSLSESFIVAANRCLKSHRDKDKLNTELDVLSKPLLDEFWTLETISLYQNDSKLRADKSHRLYAHGNEINKDKLYEATRAFFSSEPGFEPLCYSLQLDSGQAQKSEGQKLSQNEVLKKKDRAQTIAFEAESSKVRLDQAKEKFRTATLTRQYDNVLKSGTITELGTTFLDELSRRVDSFSEEAQETLEEKKQEKNADIEGNRKALLSFKQTLTDITSKVQHIETNEETSDLELILHLQSQENPKKVVLCHNKSQECYQVCHLKYDDANPPVPHLERHTISVDSDAPDKRQEATKFQDNILESLSLALMDVNKQKDYHDNPPQDAKHLLVSRVNLHLKTLEPGDKVQYELINRSIEELSFSEQDIEYFLIQKNADIVNIPQRNEDGNIVYHTYCYDDQGQLQTTIQEADKLTTNCMQQLYQKFNPGKKDNTEIAHLGFYTKETFIGGDQKDSSIGVTHQYIDFDDTNFLFGEEPLTWHYLMQIFNRNRSFLGNSLKELEIIIPDGFYPERDISKMHSFIYENVTRNTHIHNQGSLYGYMLATQEIQQQQTAAAIDELIEEQEQKPPAARMERRRSILPKPDSNAFDSHESSDAEDDDHDSPTKLVETTPQRPKKSPAPDLTPVKIASASSQEPIQERTNEDYIAALRQKFIDANLVPEMMATITIVEESKIVSNLVTHFEQSTNDQTEDKLYTNPGNNIQHIIITDDISEEELINHLATSSKNILLCQKGDQYDLCCLTQDEEGEITLLHSDDCYTISQDFETLPDAFCESIQNGHQMLENQDELNDEQKQRLLILNTIKSQLTKPNNGDRIQYFLPQTSLDDLQFNTDDLILLLEDKKADIIITPKSITNPKNEEQELYYQISLLAATGNRGSFKSLTMKIDEFNISEVATFYAEHHPDKPFQDASTLQFSTEEISLGQDQVTKQYMHFDDENFLNAPNSLTWVDIIERNKCYSKSSPQDLVVIVPNDFYRTLDKDYSSHRQDMIDSIVEIIDENTQSQEVENTIKNMISIVEERSGENTDTVAKKLFEDAVESHNQTRRSLNLDVFRTPARPSMKITPHTDGLHIDDYPSSAEKPDNQSQDMQSEGSYDDSDQYFPDLDLVEFIHPENSYMKDKPDGLYTYLDFYETQDISIYETILQAILYSACIMQEKMKDDLPLKLLQDIVTTTVQIGEASIYPEDIFSDALDEETRTTYQQNIPDFYSKCQEMGYHFQEACEKCGLHDLTENLDGFNLCNIPEKSYTAFLDLLRRSDVHSQTTINTIQDLNNYLENYVATIIRYSDFLDQQKSNDDNSQMEEGTESNSPSPKQTQQMLSKDPRIKT